MERVHFNEEDDKKIKKYMKKLKNFPIATFELVKKWVTELIQDKFVNVCHDSFNDGEKSYIDEWVEKYKIRNPSAEKISWSELIPDMKKKFGKLRSENKLKNYWHYQRRQKERNTSQGGPSGINHNLSNNDQGSSEIKKDPRMEISYLTNC
ncbi:hypothetical protein C1646_662815 [Rhizophagus diaphanus]|nr:hypothetical protein C1646_662815 [Rhizophagus diaphanus] [Rhizophagus sp. MUCL 43196]